MAEFADSRLTAWPSFRSGVSFAHEIAEAESCRARAADSEKSEER